MKYLSTYFVAVLAIIVLISFNMNAKPTAAVSLADKVIDRGEIRIGYIVYPPLLIKDEKTGELSGISHDLVEAAAAKLGLKTNWVEEVAWGSAIEGLKTERYDILGTQMWPNSARAREATFSRAPMNSVVYPYVRIGDHRFDGDLAALNSSQYTIGVLDGEMSTFIAKESYPQAKVNALPSLASYAEVFLGVVQKKADVTFAEPSVANGFIKTNPGKIERLAAVEPVRTLGNSFVFAREQGSMVSMWNVAIGELINDGTVARILEKYGVAADYQLNK